MNIATPLTSTHTGASVGRGYDVESADRRGVPAKTGSTLFHNPLSNPKPITTQRFIKR